MNPLELIRNGGMFAMAAVVAGLFGAVLGLIGLIGPKNKSAVLLACVTVLCGVFAAGLGMLGTVVGKSQVDEAIANVNPTDRERIRLMGFKEAQDASLVGFAASLLPLFLGAVVIAGARMKTATAAPVVSALARPAAAAEADGLNNIAFIVLGLGALLGVGALLMSRMPLPLGKYDLPMEDSDAWALAGALEEVTTDPMRGCPHLDTALRRFTDAGRKEPASLQWHAAADFCVDAWVKKVPQEPQLSVEGMLGSPLLYNERLRAQVMNRNWGPDSAPVPPDPVGQADDPPEPEGPELSPVDISGVVRKSLPQFRACYEKQLRINPKLEGTLTIRFVIAASGEVSEAAEDSLKFFPSEATRECVIDRFRRLQFPAHGGKPVVVKYPFVFKAN